VKQLKGLNKKTARLTHQSGLITNHRRRKSLMYIHPHMLMVGLQNNMAMLVVVGKNVQVKLLILKKLNFIHNLTN
jgi:ribosomal protein S8E